MQPVSERRRHRMYVTQNTEYHLRDDLCVAVRDRTTGIWAQGHRAVGKRLAGGICFAGDGTCVPRGRAGDVRAGDCLCFSGRSFSDSLVTSAVLAVDRPPRDAVAHYVH